MNAISCTTTVSKQTSIFGVKIESTCFAYSDIDNQCTCWENDTSTYCLWGDNMTIRGQVDIEFMKFINPKTVLTNIENAKLLKLTPIQNGEVMVKNIFSKKKDIPKIFFDDINNLYILFKSLNMELDFEGFKLDTLLKLRRGLGAIACIYENDELIACALSTYITDDYAIINAVAVKEEYQKQGYGKSVLNKLEEQLSGRTIYLLKEENENDIFYKKLEYSPVDKWVLGGYNV